MKAFAIGIARRARASASSTACSWRVLDLPALVVTLGTLYVVAGIRATIVGGKRITPDHLPDDVIRSASSACSGYRS